MREPHFSSPSPFDPSHPNALAMYCSDGRFTRAVEDLVRSLGFDRLDTLTIPGGAALLVPASAKPSELEHIRGAADFLIEAHHITEIALIAHEGCAYYKRHHPTWSSERIHEQQISDLREAALWLRAGHPRDLEIDLYYAVGTAQNIEFHRVD